MQQISEDDRSALRFFAYWIANTTLIINLIEEGEEEPDYLDAIREEPALLRALFAAHLAEDFGGEDASEWLLAHLREPTAAAPLPDLPAEAPGWMTVVVDFADALARDRLPECPEASRLLHCNGGSPLEQVFAVLTNVLRVDEDGAPLNAAHARQRAGQMAARLLDDRRPEIAFTRDETELV